MRSRFLIPWLLLVLLSGCSQPPSTAEERKERIKSVETSATTDALNRKARSDARLISEGVPVNNYLPATEDISDVKRRTKEEIAWRAMALLVVAVKGEGLEQPAIEKIVEDYSLEGHFTPKELAFIQEEAPSEHDRAQFAWRYEAAWTLLWSLGYVDSLGKPTAICDVPRAVELMKNRSPKQFIADAKLRSIESISEEADLIYRYHWSVVDARVKGRPAPGSLEPGVTMERHYALNWLIGYMDQEWDDISTDT